MGLFQPPRRKAETLLLAWLSASLKPSRSMRCRQRARKFLPFRRIATLAVRQRVGEVDLKPGKLIAALVGALGLGLAEVCSPALAGNEIAGTATTTTKPA